jgi:hypothetical protein
MIVINGKEVNGYDDYQQLNGEDIVAFMKTQSAEDIVAFKQFCSEPKVTKYADGTTKNREASFFEIRNWVLDKYAPGIRTPKRSKVIGSKLIDQIMDL